VCMGNEADKQGKGLREDKEKQGLRVWGTRIHWNEAWNKAKGLKKYTTSFITSTLLSGNEDERALT
jgi:hypothetical protein